MIERKGVAMENFAPNVLARFDQDLMQKQRIMMLLTSYLKGISFLP